MLQNNFQVKDFMNQQHSPCGRELARLQLGYFMIHYPLKVIISHALHISHSFLSFLHPKDIKEMKKKTTIYRK